MLLSDIRTYCAEAGRVSLHDLSNRFEAEPEAMRGMMDVLTQKGIVRCVTEPGAACGKTCCGCSSGCDALRSMPDAIYEWVGRQRRAH